MVSQEGPYGSEDEFAESPEAQQLLREVEALAAMERKDLATAPSLEVETGRGERALKELMLREAPPQNASAHRSLWPWFMLAAGLLLAFFGYREIFPNEVALEPRQILGDQAKLLEPRGKVLDYGTFRWEMPCPKDGFFVIRVFGEDFETSSERTKLQSWTPADTTNWPSSIEWTLEVSSIPTSSGLQEVGREWATR